MAGGRMYKKGYSKRAVKYGKANKALSIARKNRRMLLASETKYIFKAEDDEDCIVTGEVKALSNVVQGDDNITRDGKKIQVFEWSLDMNMTLGTANADNDLVRVIGVIDKQTNGATYGIAELLQTTSAGNILVSSIFINNKKRFRILFDRTYKLTSGGTEVAHLRYRKKLNLPIQYDANNGNVADLVSNSFSFFIANANANVCTYTYESKISFKDM